MSYLAATSPLFPVPPPPPEPAKVIFSSDQVSIATYRRHANRPDFEAPDRVVSGHLIVFPDTRELVVQDFRDLPFTRKRNLRKFFRRSVQSLGRHAVVRRYPVIGQDSMVVLDLDTGEEKGRVKVPSPTQSFLFPAPGFDRDLYFLSMSSMARITVE